jgi:hypothetical protein
VAIDREIHAQDILNSICDVNRATRVLYPMDEDRELISSEASNRVTWPQEMLEPPRNADQQLVAHAVAQTVVDVLETIEVEIQDCEMW